MKKVKHIKTKLGQWTTVYTGTKKVKGKVYDTYDIVLVIGHIESEKKK